MTIPYYQYHINNEAQNLFLDQGSFLSTWTCYFFILCYMRNRVCAEVKTVKKLLFMFLSPRFVWWYCCDSSNRSYPGTVMLSFSLVPENSFPGNELPLNLVCFSSSALECVLPLPPYFLWGGPLEGLLSLLRVLPVQHKQVITEMEGFFHKRQ